MLPPHLERIREKLAENIHELWALTRIEQGWTYGSVSVACPTPLWVAFEPVGASSFPVRRTVGTLPVQTRYP